MAHTQTDLDNIKSALASGEQSVEVDGRKVVYRSVDDLIKARDQIAAELAANSSAQSVRRGTFAVRFSTARGF